jgi:hypothetical protein
MKQKIYKLKGTSTPLSYSLRTRNTRRKPLLYFDGNSNRPLRYAMNQKSPFEDEQDGNAVLEPVVFEDGMLVVPSNNPVLQEFLSLHPGNGSEFIEVDNEKDATKDIEKLDLEIDAMVAVKDLDLEILETIGRISLGLNTDTMSTAELKRDVRLFAKNSPSDFLNTLNDPMLKLQSLAAKSLDENLLKIKNKGKDIYFNLPSNKKKLMSIPFGETPIHMLSNFFQTDDGVELMKLLESKLED